MEDHDGESGIVTLEGALERADQAQDALESLFRLLASSVDVTGDIESRMEESRAARDAALLLLGRHVLRWHRDGGGIILEEPEEDLDAPEEPEEPEEPVAEPADTPEIEAALAAEPADACDDIPLETIVTYEPPEPSAEPPRIPASAESISALAAGIGVSWTAQPPPTSSLDRILSELSPPPAEAQIKEQLRRILELNPHTWRGMPTPIQRDLTALLAAWGRHLQEKLGAEHREDLTHFFGRLTEYSRIEQPGFVFGLNQKHRPQNGSWLADALEAWFRLAPDTARQAITPEIALRTLEESLHLPDIRLPVLVALQSGLDDTDPRLVQLLAARVAELDNEPRLRKLRKAIRQHSSQERAKPTEVVTKPWLHHETTSQWRVVVLGGDRPKKLNPLLKAAFGFSNIRHESGKQMRRVHQIRESILAGKIDLCLVVTRFLSHKASGSLIEACQERGVQVVRIGGGLSMEPIREALTARLGGEE